MGPRLVSRGNGAPAHARPARAKLQWGHGLLAVEIVHAAKRRLKSTRLQWGHGLLAVEISLSSDSADRDAAASMGPRLVSRGNGQGVTGPNPGPGSFIGA